MIIEEGFQDCIPMSAAMGFHVAIRVYLPASLYSHATSVHIFNGSNFTEWREHVKFTLGVHDLDGFLLIEKLSALTDTGSKEDKRMFEAWERSNRLSLMYMKMTIASNIKTSLPNVRNAKEFLKLVDKRFRSADKSLARTLMAHLNTMKYDGAKGMWEHIIEMTNIAAKLDALGMSIAECFLVRFILNSLPPLCGPFQINYDSLKEQWNMSELTNMLVQEEERLKQHGNFTANVVTQLAQNKRWKTKRGKKLQPPKSEGHDDVVQVKTDEQLRCHFCRKPGHFQNECLK
ncbi:uncharacterized protein LOC113279608 [Papaver somniferum]|uniref:uncharacterized protein LOC113279608 n=1 Tax=Papaver somniferum TaxID=3469 RepID=UPI000E705D0D|nr:uncharacterized protein LOC113279608 [Papaver somniferum]